MNQFIEWKGGECPLEPDTKVEIKMVSGYIDGGRARDYDWNHIEGDEGNIVGYRVLP